MPRLPDRVQGIYGVLPEPEVRAGPRLQILRGPLRQVHETPQFRLEDFGLHMEAEQTK